MEVSHENNLETAQLQAQINAYVAGLSENRLKVALDFVSYLSDREEAEATEELLALPNFDRDLAVAERRANAGELVDWNDIKEDV